MKRMFELTSNDVLETNKETLLNRILHTEGRTLMAETVISCAPFSEGVSNPELAAAFGADMITLNTLDLTAPYIEGLYEEDYQWSTLSEKYQKHADFIHRMSQKNCISDLKNIIGRFVGCNLEPVPENISYPEGYKATYQNFQTAHQLGLDYVVITGNPNTMITEAGITDAIRSAKEASNNELLVIAGKMHGAGTGNTESLDTIRNYCKAGADIIMIPAPFTTPKMSLALASEMIAVVHEEGKMALCAMGTSQEGSDRTIVEQIALNSKTAGADIIHIGDAGFAGIADPENIKYCSIAIRGKRHTYRRIGLRR
ncbi:dihydrodipicolinate synthase [Vibrio sp. SS-MA-C1-2]|uniref:DUF7916 family protein n=1 Tax=Vibrio sp. SS-MA-C1-2 TaxID=2908646 RepID=UPI001F336164|nr:dihydrodipicolinate synthase [Vibrio sp. SS-MA-C1-2]UJF18502.1 dihydrodipicolinate synthase [Vibrio sp. SS-MA-C1-2]